jgi:uncharacterized protein
MRPRCPPTEQGRASSVWRYLAVPGYRTIPRESYSRPMPEPTVEGQIRLRHSFARQLLAFFILAYVIGWSSWLPAFTIAAVPKPVALIGLFAPALAGLIVAGWADGQAGIRAILARFRIWRFGLRWYFVALGLIPAIFVVVALATTVLTGLDFEHLAGSNPWYFVVASFIFLMVITSGEEIGWRGFALSRLEATLGGSFRASLVLGVLWGFWHLPLYLLPGQSRFPFVLFLLLTVGLSILYSVLFKRTQGSLLAAVLLHSSTDIMPRLMQIAEFTALTWAIIVALVWSFAILLELSLRMKPLNNKSAFASFAVDSPSKAARSSRQ